MKKQLLAYFITVSVATFVPHPAAAQSTPPATDAEKEATYAKAIEYRTDDILKALNLTDPAKSMAVHDVMVDQYHNLRVRDAAIDTRLRVDGKEVNYVNRAPQLALQSKSLHDEFLAKLSGLLTPDQVEQVKDLMTYHKVKVTYDAYCQIVPNLTDAEKARILELLKQAREEAIDGGNAPEKSAIFQKYKDQINSYLDAQGHNTADAFKTWAAAHPNTNSPAVK